MNDKRAYDRRNTTKEQVKSVKAHSRALEALGRLFDTIEGGE
jgi:hypothetical protein